MMHKMNIWLCNIFRKSAQPMMRNKKCSLTWMVQEKSLWSSVSVNVYTETRCAVLHECTEKMKAILWSRFLEYSLMRMSTIKWIHFSWTEMLLSADSSWTLGLWSKDPCNETNDALNKSRRKQTSSGLWAPFHFAESVLLLFCHQVSSGNEWRNRISRPFLRPKCHTT